MIRPIVVSGNLSLDDTINPDGVFPEAPGGDALYASLGVRAWGATPILLTLVGDDYPAAHLERMLAAGIDVSRVRTTAGPTVHYTVSNRADGSRTYGWVSAEDRLLLTSPALEDYGALAGAAWLHVAAMPIEAQEVGVAAGRAAGVPVSLDPHEEYVAGVEDRLAAMVEGAWFLPSELEARLLFPDLGALDGVELGFATAERLDAWNPAGVAVKLGALGSITRRDGSSTLVPAPVIRVVDTTGAGDAYAGGFIVGLLVTDSAVAAAACGTVAAAETIGTVGAFQDGRSPSPQDRLEGVIGLLRRRREPELANAVDRLRDHLLSHSASRP